MRTLLLVVMSLGLKSNVLAETLHDTFDDSTLDLKSGSFCRSAPTKFGCQTRTVRKCSHRDPAQASGWRQKLPRG